jgi:hypothetical protein
MGMKWNDLSGTLQSKLEQEILNYSSNVVDQGESSETKELWLGPNLDSSAIFSYFLQACRDLDYRWNMKTRVREAIFSAFCQCFHPNQGFSVRNLLRSLTAIVRVGVKGNDIPADVKMTLFEGIKLHSEKLDLTQLFHR